MINWSNVTVKLSDLTPWEHNPRTMTKAQAKRLLKSWHELGQFQTIAIGPHGEVYDGHQRLSALLAAHGAAYQIEARQSDRALTDDERQALTLAANIGAGQWNWDALAAWDVTTLTDWGMDSDTLKTWNNDALNLRLMIEGETDIDDAFGALPDEDRAPFQQMTFTLHDSQVETINEAMSIAKKMGDFDSENQNSNGNALARVCETFITNVSERDHS